MNPFTYSRASSADDAAAMTFNPGDRLLGGGTNLVDLMRKGIEHPLRTVDVTGLSDRIEALENGGLMIGGATRNSAVASHPLVRSRYPMLSRAILAGASAQIRNMATVAGNVMQRTRCPYFNDIGSVGCNKRVPGSGCDALGGFNRYHAILGTSTSCIATHPSDMCVALAALDARVHVFGTDGARIIPIVDFHRLPGDSPHLETVIGNGDVITAIEIPATSFVDRSAYRKVRDRASYAFALVSVAAGVTMRDDVIDEIRIALGGVAPKPWRAFKAEAALRGGRPTVEAFRAAMDAELADAVPQSGNAFKIELARRTVSAVLTEVTGDDR